MRTSPLAACLLLFSVAASTTASAAWTGISAFAGEQRQDWSFGTTSRRAESFTWGLSIEERTRAGLRIGLAGGRFSLDLRNNAPGPFDEFAGEFLQFYLRWPVALGDHLTLHGRFDYRVNHGDDELTTSEEEIEWTERSLTLGLALRYGILSLQPFVKLLSSDGDLDDLASGIGQPFDSDNRQSHGLIIDLHVEKTAYVRLLSEFSDIESLQVHFVRAF